MDDFDKLKSIPVQQIFDETHIRTNVIDAILSKDFSRINGVQARGFISIIENQYSLDLHEWLIEFFEYKKNNDTTKSQYVINNIPEHNVNISYKSIYTILILFISSFAVIWYIKSSHQASIIKQQPDNTVINNINSQTDIIIKSSTKNEERNVTEIISSSSSFQSTDIAEQNITENNITIVKDFHIKPSRSLWFEIHYTDTNAKEEHKISRYWDLDPNREQIITFGHPFFVINIGNEVFKPSKIEGKIKVLFNNGTLKEIE
jgi:hypothetical protein